MKRVAATFAALWIFITLPAHAQTAFPGLDAPGLDEKGQHFSPLTQISRDSVEYLEIA